MCPQQISITSEREDNAATPDRPSFLKGVQYNSTNPATWYEKVLPYLAECTFVIASTADVTYAGAILASSALPDLHSAVTKLHFPKFYWFSGIGSNRLHNPCMQLARTLVNLHELTITLHPGGLTHHRWAEREMLEMERTNPEGAKERLLLPLGEVVHFFEFDALSTCGGLLRLHLEYIESSLMRHFCKTGNPVEVFYALKTYLEQEFARKHMHVVVTAQIVTAQIDEEDI
ncbi:hypothetical protein G6514_005941 [Epicoccum nigrum]|nr:hypothetical protein G6514_005941 [Epicoccum nigrum]